MNTQKNDDIDWKNRLTPEQYKVLRQKGTEAPFSGDLLTENRDGSYHCVGCNNALFKSSSKYESDIAGLAGWPSFSEAVDTEKILLRNDFDLGMKRVEVLCANCGGHLGHLFPDNGSPSGQHYCINSVALDFKPEKS